MRVEATADQRVTIIGSHPSLEMALKDLSWRAGFEVRHFDIEDRPIDVRIEGRSLPDALRRLLGRDSFVAGVVGGEDGTARVRWISVLGEHDRARERRAHGNAIARPASFQVPPPLFLAAFAGKDPAATLTALETIKRRILEEPSEMEAFLRTDVALIVSALEQYPQAPAIFAALATQPMEDPRLRAKLDEIVAALGPTLTKSASLRGEHQ